MRTPSEHHDKKHVYTKKQITVATIFAMLFSVLIVLPFLLLIVNLMLLYPRFVYLCLFAMTFILSLFWFLSAHWFLVVLRQYHTDAIERTLKHSVFVFAGICAGVTLIALTVVVFLVTPYFLS